MPHTLKGQKLTGLLLSHSVATPFCAGLLYMREGKKPNLAGKGGLYAFDWVELVEWVEEERVNHSVVAYHEVYTWVAVTLLTVCYCFTIRVEGEVENERVGFCDILVDAVEELFDFSLDCGSVEVPRMNPVVNDVVDGHFGERIHSLEVKVGFFAVELLVESVVGITQVYFVVLNGDGTSLGFTKVVIVQIVGKVGKWDVASHIPFREGVFHCAAWLRS